MGDSNRRSLVSFGVLLVLLGVSPLVVYPVFLMKALCFGLFACAFNLLLGQANLLSFGHAMFFGMGGYAAAHAAKHWALPTELALLFGVAVASALGFAVGLLAIRRQGIYFAMITLGLAQLVYFWCLRSPLTGGEDGIQAVPRGKLLGVVDLNDNGAMYALVAVLFLAGFLLLQRIVHSPFGEVLRAIREHEQRAVSLGYEVDRYKLTAFVLSAALTGLAGATKALVFQLASLTDVHWTTSGEVVLMTLLGGLGRSYGPLIGAVLVVALEQYLGPYGAWVTVIQGVIFVLCVLTFRQGIAGALARKEAA